MDLGRGIACLLVIAFHSTFYARQGEPSFGAGSAAAEHALFVAERMWIGVTIFFVISGYCIAATADASRRKAVAVGAGVGAGVGEFFRRRFKRIFPPYWIAFVLTAAVFYVVERWVWPGLFTDGNHGFSPPHELDVWQWVGNITLTELWRPHVVGERPANFFLGHAWTLGYEEQFYAVMGLLLILARRWIFVGAAVVTLAVAAMFKTAYYNPGAWDYGFFFDGRWIYFACGVLLYVQINYFPARLRHVTTLALAGGAVAAGWDVTELLKPDISPMRELFVALCTAVVFAVLQPADEFLNDARVMRPLRWCGVMCYSVYLVHWPIVKMVSHGLHLAGVRGPMATMLIVVPACAAATLLCAWVFHRAVERRFMNVPTVR